MSYLIRKGVVWLAILMIAAFARADGWNYSGNLPGLQYGSAGNRFATDGTNLYYSSVLDGVFRTPLADQNFSAMPMTGFPSWDPNANTNGFAVWNIHIAPRGTLLISGSPINVTAAGINPPPSPFNNTLPVFYWWDETNQLWHPALVSGKSYPYTASAGNFYNAPDGSVWTCSGFYPYAYRSTDDGHSFAAFDINARVPANYFPLPLTTNQFSFGKIFGCAVGWNGEVVLGSETGGYLHSTNNGTNWTSLDPNFTNWSSVNPLGRIGNSVPAGLDHYGNFLLANPEMSNFPGLTNWSSVTLIGYHPADGTYFNAANGFPPNLGPGRVITLPSGMTYCFLNQGSNNLGGVYRAFDGKNWTQFNDNLPVVSLNVGNAVASGNCITAVSNQILIAFGNIWSFDATPAPVTNIPPVALPQRFNLTRNTAKNFTLAGQDANGDALNYTILTLPVIGTLSGTPPNLTYLPPTNSGGTDRFMFAVNDGIVTSAPATVVFAINPPTNALPTISLTSSIPQGWAVGPTNLTLTASVTAPLGFQQVTYYFGTNVLTPAKFFKISVTSPYTCTFTNLQPGDYFFNAFVGDKSENSIWAQPLRLSVLAATPTVKITSVDAANVAVTWPLALDNLYLESAPAPTGPWTLAPQAPEFFTNGETATIPAGDQQFFRLFKP